MNISEFKETFFEYTRKRKYNEALALVDLALAERIPPDQLITRGIAENLNRFQSFLDEGYINTSAFQLLAIGKISEDSIEKIKPHLPKKEVSKGQKRIVLGTIKNDFHGLGIKILKLFLELENFDVIYLGLDVKPEEFIKTVEETNAEYLFIGTMMLHNIIGIKKVGDLLDQKNLRDKVKFYVGGAPFNYNYNLLKKVGANDSAEDIYELLNKLLGRPYKDKLKRKKRFRFFRKDK